MSSVTVCLFVSWTLLLSRMQLSLISNCRLEVENFEGEPEGWMLRVEKG